MFENLIYLKFVPPEILLSLKIIFIVIFLFLLFIIFYSLRKSSWLINRFLQDTVEFLTYRPYGVKKIVKIWSKIKERLEKDQIRFIAEHEPKDIVKSFSDSGMSISPRTASNWRNYAYFILFIKRIARYIELFKFKRSSEKNLDIY